MEPGSKAAQIELHSAEKSSADIAVEAKNWEQSRHHPRNWPLSRRWKNALIVSVTGFLSTTGSSILVPAAPLIQREFNVGTKEVVTLTTALYVAGLGCGPFIYAPISELYGRQIAYSSSMLGFTILNLACCFAPNISSLIVLRFFAGVFGSSGPGLGTSTISDLFAPRERGRVLSIYAIGPMLGPTGGSILASYLVLLEWRWTLRVLTILVGLNTVAIVLFMDETFASVLEKLHREQGTEEITYMDRLKAMFRPNPQAKDVVIRTFTRPPRMLLNPVCALFVVYYSYIYSIIYVYLVSLPLLFAQHDPPLRIFSYNWPPATVGLSYLGLAVGFLSAATFAANFADRIYKYCSNRFQDEGQPEYRLVITQGGMLVFPVGVLIWAWTAQAQTHWIAPMIGCAILAFGLMCAFNSIQNWIVDAFFPSGLLSLPSGLITSPSCSAAAADSAAAMAAATLLRSVAGCILPIFAQSLFVNLDYGWGGTLLALVSLPAVPAPFVLFMYGRQLRERFKFKP